MCMGQKVRETGYQERFKTARYLLGLWRWLIKPRHAGQIAPIILEIVKDQRIIPLLIANRNVEGLIDFNLGIYI